MVPMGRPIRMLEPCQSLDRMRLCWDQAIKKAAEAGESREREEVGYEWYQSSLVVYLTAHS